MKKIFVLLLSVLCSHSILSQSKYKIEINVGEHKDAGTEGVVKFTLVGAKGQFDLIIDNSDQDDFVRSAKTIFFTPAINIGNQITDIRLEIAPKKKEKLIDDLYVKKIRVTSIKTNKSTGNITIKKWIGGGDKRKKGHVLTKEIKDWN